MKEKQKIKLKRVRPTVKVKPRSYQPNKAELQERAYLPTTPKRAAKAVASLVNVQETKYPK